MFRRRQKHSIHNRLTNLVWPRIGWARSARYALYRLARLPHTLEATAAALAIGAAITFIPLPGFHLLLAIALCWLARLPILPGCLGTLVGNPWTLPPAFLASYELGQWGVRALTDLPARDMPVDMTFDIFWNLLAEDPWILMMPWIAGGVVLAVLSFPLFYILFAAAVRQGHDARAAFLTRWREGQGKT